MKPVFWTITITIIGVLIGGPAFALLIRRDPIAIQTWNNFLPAFLIFLPIFIVTPMVTGYLFNRGRKAQ